MSQPPPPAPLDSSSPPSTGVRRHHTISASSRAARANARDQIDEEVTPNEQVWNDDEVVDHDWVGGVGAVGEKSGLHRQTSLPTRYHRGFQSRAHKAGNPTPSTLNSLTAIAGNEGDEEDWEREMRGLRDEEERKSITNLESQPHQHQLKLEGHLVQAPNQSPLATGYGRSDIPSPPPAESGVRRHQSLTAKGAGGLRQLPPSSLRRSGTLQAQMRHRTDSNQGHRSNSPADPEEDYVEDENPYTDDYFQQQQTQHSTARSPWNTPGTERRPQGHGGSGFGSSGSNNAAVDDITRALTALEMSANQNQMYQQQAFQQGGQSAYPPRFNPYHPSPNMGPVARSNNNNGNGNLGSFGHLRLSTDFDSPGGPASASAFVPSIGQNLSQQQFQPSQKSQNNDERSLSASGTNWDQKDKILGTRQSNQNLHYGYQQGQQGKNIPNVPPVPQQYLQQQGGQVPRLGIATSFGQNMQVGLGLQGQQSQAYANTPIDVPSLIATKGYNPQNFDTRPQFARFFVIKSYTEDDVHKSLKYEIWSSTDPGNKRLDKAFKETAGRGPIYLFFSVNASGHFCGMAEMLTPVDYTRSSTVWASDKWKGVFKVHWIFVRDIPNVNLRHIKLNNTQERKPVTNSRDTQELLPEAGQEMLKIFLTHPARTSLLQDFAFYELQAMQKLQATGAPSSPNLLAPIQLQNTGSQTGSQPNAQGNRYMNSMSPAGMSYQMSPTMQMQMQMGGGMTVGQQSQFGGMPQNQAMHQSVMRHPSPQPQNNGAGFLGLSGF